MNEINPLAVTLLENLSALLKEADSIFSRNELIEMFCRRILPVLKEHPLLEPLRTKWEERREELDFEIQKTEKDAFNESVSTFRKIERALKNAKKPIGEKTAKQLKKVNQILSGEERYCSPPLYRVIFDEIRILFYFLLEEGHEDICRRFAKINTRKTYVQEDLNAKDQYGDWDENGKFRIFTEDEIKLLSEEEKIRLCWVPQKMKLIDQSYIETFEFCPTYGKTFSVNKAASVDRIHDSAVVWWYFDIALLYWNTPASFFDKPVPKQNTKKSCENYFKCLCDIQCWREIAGARDSKFQVESPIIFTEGLFKKGLRTIIAEIRDYFSKGNDERDKYSEIALEIILNDYSQKVELKTNFMWISVSEGNADPQYYNLKRFNDESNPLNFARLLLEKYVNGGSVEVEFESPSESMPKYLSRIGIEGELRKVFFGKSRKNTVLFNGKKVVFKKKEIKNFNLLLRQLKEKHQENGSPIFEM